MSSDWWARKLSGQPEPPRPVSTPPVSPPMRTAIRIPTPAQTAPQQYQHQHHQQQPVRTDVLDPNREPNAQITMGEAIRLWKGGEANRRENMTCPSCGSDHVFSRSKGTMINGANPAPLCHACGWNGRFEQGAESNWV